MRRLPPVLLEDGCSIELLSLIRTILAACKEISFRVGQGALSGVLGSTLDENIQGETQKLLDVVSNQLLKTLLLENKYVKAIKRAKKNFVRNLANKSNDGVWKILKSNKPTDWDSVIHGSSFSNRTDLAEGFASHFNGKVKKLQSTREIFQKSLLQHE